MLSIFWYHQGSRKLWNFIDKFLCFYLFVFTWTTLGCTQADSWLHTPHSGITSRSAQKVICSIKDWLQINFTNYTIFLPIVILVLFVCLLVFWSHPAVLSAYSWFYSQGSLLDGLRDHKWYWESNPGWPHAR